MENGRHTAERRGRSNSPPRRRSRSRSRDRRSRSRSRSRRRDDQATSTTRLYIGNLGWSVKVEELKEMFAPYGQIEDAHVALERDTGKSRGFGFITMATEAQAKAAKDAMDNKDIDGRVLHIDFARPKGSDPRRRRPSRGPPPRSYRGSPDYDRRDSSRYGSYAPPSYSRYDDRDRDRYREYDRYAPPYDARYAPPYERDPRDRYDPYYPPPPTSYAPPPPPPPARGYDERRYDDRRYDDRRY